MLLYIPSPPPFTFPVTKFPFTDFNAPLTTLPSTCSILYKVSGGETFLFRSEVRLLTFLNQDYY